MGANSARSASRVAEAYQPGVGVASLQFPGGEPEGPSVHTAIPGPKSKAQHAQLAAFQDAAGVKYFGASWHRGTSCGTQPCVPVVSALVP